jgi:hypothetical protein
MSIILWQCEGLDRVFSKSQEWDRDDRTKKYNPIPTPNPQPLTPFCLLPSTFSLFLLPFAFLFIFHPSSPILSPFPTPQIAIES